MGKGGGPEHAFHQMLLLLLQRLLLQLLLRWQRLLDGGTGRDRMQQLLLRRRDHAGGSHQLVGDVANHLLLLLQRLREAGRGKNVSLQDQLT